MNDAIEIMDEEGENEVIFPIAQQPCQHSVSISFAVEPHQRKRSRKDPLVEVVTDTGSSLKKYFTAKKNKEHPQPSGKEIHIVDSKV